MPHHDVAVAHSAWSWRPSTGHAALEQLVGIGWVIQQSDRSDAAQSRRIEHEIGLWFNLDHHVVSELVLGDHR